MPLSIDNILLDDIEKAFEGENTETEGCSSLMTPAPPKRIIRNLLSSVTVSDFLFIWAQDGLTFAFFIFYKISISEK